jgi:hypothetical protein
LATDWILPRVGGIEKQLADLARALNERGHEAHVLSTTPGLPFADGVTVRRLAAAPALGFGFAISAPFVRTLRPELAGGRCGVATRM